MTAGPLHVFVFVRRIFSLWIVLAAIGPAAHSAGEGGEYAFSEKFMVRFASYSVQNADTSIAVANSSSGVGVGYSFNDDLGGEDSSTSPRIDAYYRFNERHRIEFAVFEVDRRGRELLAIDVDLGDQSFVVGDTVDSDIELGLLKIGYGYSLYHGDRVELIATAGINVTGYDFGFELADGTRAGSADVTAPLPMFGLKVSYAINSNWSLHYISESFYIEIENAMKGSFTNNEIDIQYWLGKSLVLGAGITRFSFDVEADDSNWKGRIADSHRGLLVFAGYYL